MASFKYLSLDEKLERLQNLVDSLKNKIESDKNFYLIAMNLTGEREKIENEAFELIKKHGELGALKISKKII